MGEGGEAVRLAVAGEEGLAVVIEACNCPLREGSRNWCPVAVVSALLLRSAKAGKIGRSDPNSPHISPMIK